MSEAQEMEVSNVSSMNNCLITKISDPSTGHGLLLNTWAVEKLARLDARKCVRNIASSVVDMCFNKCRTVDNLLGRLSLEPL
jgi:hypothetical protein